ncbi:hypothetical protein BpHYR1_035762 [Brachionus plicatilis]|uniref:Uncharacterized protein n=1 Tax=Brachionus plicatilis TaxID=10195 RepID=A0A3M7Q9K4_BRAPC|nr:hypothetical protein BpHYR1_035762 [Brachionus plicatilis]
MDPLEVDSLNKENDDPDESILPFIGKSPKTIEIPLLSIYIAKNMQDPRKNLFFMGEDLDNIAYCFEELPNRYLGKKRPHNNTKILMAPSTLRLLPFF